MDVICRVIDIILSVLLASGVGMYFYHKAERKRIRREFIEKRDCCVCVHRGTMNCPNSSLCWSTVNKPYFDPEKEDNKK